MRVFKLLATFCFLILTSLQSHAHPTFIYGFSVTSFSCEKHPFVSCREVAAFEAVPNWSGPLDQLTIGFNIDAVFAQYTSLDIDGFGSPENTRNRGVNFFNPMRWNVGTGALDLYGITWADGPNKNFWVESLFKVSEYLTGSLYINDSLDELFMEASDSNS